MSDDKLKDLAHRLGLTDQDLEDLNVLLRRRRTQPVSTATTIVYGEYAESPIDSQRRLMEPSADGSKYEDVGQIGQGGTSEIRRVHDGELRRDMAMKILWQGPATGSDALARFLEEAQVTAQLQHPAIVPVFELGRLPDDRTYFTMEEVRGRTLGDVIESVHLASQDVWGKTEDGWTLRRLIEVFRRVCEAVAYAHSRGVVHRDIKPDNIMVGEFGEVKLMDWGLAKVLGAEATEIPFTVNTVRSEESDRDALSTRTGVIAGTPSFMAPEQADYAIGPISRRTDVYSLGAVLYYILANRSHYGRLNTMQVLYRVVNGSPDPLVGRADGPMLPKPLIAIWERATQRDPADRYPDANAIGQAVAHWLDGAERREAAMRSVQRAALERRETRGLQRAARAIRKEGQRLLAHVPVHALEDQKAPGWAKLDEADLLERDAQRHEQRMEEHLNAAFTHDPQLPEAHLTMIQLYARRHKAAEQRGDDQVAREHLWILRRHLDALSPEWPGRGQFENYVDGSGQLNLKVEPAGATIRMSRYVIKNRRLVPEFIQDLETTEGLALPMGSYLLEISAQGRESVRYPVSIRRSATWTGSVTLPTAGTVRDSEIIICGGPFRAGLDNHEAECETFVTTRFPVSQGEWAEFVSATQSMQPDLPVTGITWDEATQFAKWQGTQDGVIWRLPDALEWEKAARGCDGRRLPWGDLADPSWANIRGSNDGESPGAIDLHPFDESPYGVRGMGGNTADWTADPCGPDEPNARMVCGGTYADEAEDLHMAHRRLGRLGERSIMIGLRLVRTL